MSASEPAPADPDEHADRATGVAQVRMAGRPGDATAGSRGTGSPALLILALLGAVAADAAEIGGDPGSRGWARPGAFALLGAVGAGAVLAVSFGLARLMERRRG
ncbi:MAG: hypothetical protein ACPGPE_06405 [Planctomycetota bacterium]